MQINVTLEKNSDLQAEQLRKKWYPNTDSRQVRDAFIFNQCIDRFTGELDDLIKIIENDEGKPTIQRMLTIKKDSDDRLKTIASSIGKSIASTYRAIISYTILNLEKETEEDSINRYNVPNNTQLLIEKIALMERQLAECNQTMEEIKSLL